MIYHKKTILKYHFCIFSQTFVFVLKKAFTGYIIKARQYEKEHGKMNFKQPAFELKDKLTRFRRDFHSHPEVSFCEERTSGVIRKFLQDNGIEIQEINSNFH